ncbi:MAG: PAS sensor protein [Clostridia bacterium]|nr:PAS sensor protein [Spirochaetia bacterium]
MADTPELETTPMPDWIRAFPGAVTVSNCEHRIVYMNDKATDTWAGRGGKDLLGTDLLACHTERSRAIIDRLLTEGGTNIYTIEKQGQKKLIYQTVWKDEAGQTAGLVELSLIIPMDMPHYVRS